MPAGSLRVWRLCHSRWRRAAFDGQGASRFGSRWNSKGIRVIYTSESLALAALEILVRAEPLDFRDPFIAIAADIPAGVSRAVLRADDLPARWRAHPPPSASKALGDEWARSGKTAILVVPSTVVPTEHNYLLNPAHREFSRIRIGKPTPFAFDPRLVP